MHRISLGLALAWMGCSGKPTSFSEVNTAWLSAAAKQAWQGAWVATIEREPGEKGVQAAISITGDRAKIFDGEVERDVAFVIDRPCEATFKGPGVPAFHLQFAYVAGALSVGHGAVGVRHGSAAVVCAVGRDPRSEEEGVYTLTGNECTTWKPASSALTAAWTSAVGVCVQSIVRGREEVDVGTGHYTSNLFATGELLADREFEASLRTREVIRVASYDAAKQVVARPVDPGGGLVGDHTTIAGIQATFAALRNDLTARPLEVRGVVTETSTLTVQGQVWTVIGLIDPASRGAALLCQTLDEAGKRIVTGTQIVVRGAIDPASDSPRLKPCTVGH